MRIYMQSQPESSNIPRYFQLVIHEDLLDGWNLLIENGAQGSSGRTRREHFSTWDDALGRLMQMRDLQIKRGFRVMYAQGQTQPKGV